MTERRADDATREVQAWLKCEYLQEHVGDEFDGVVAAVTGFGLFVELVDLYIEGLVHISALPGDYYHFDGGAPAPHGGERSGRSFQAGWQGAGAGGAGRPGRSQERSTWNWSRQKAAAQGKPGRQTRRRGRTSRRQEARRCK